MRVLFYPDRRGRKDYTPRTCLSPTLRGRSPLCLLPGSFFPHFRYVGSYQIGREFHSGDKSKHRVIAGDTFEIMRVYNPDNRDNEREVNDMVPGYQCTLRISLRKTSSAAALATA